MGAHSCTNLHIPRVVKADRDVDTSASAHAAPATCRADPSRAQTFALDLEIAADLLKDADADQRGVAPPETAASARSHSSQQAKNLITIQGKNSKRLVPHDLLLDAKVNRPDPEANERGSISSRGELGSRDARRQKRQSRRQMLAETTDETFQNLIRMSSQSRGRRV